MHLQRIQVPSFRVLQNIDITFEKEFTPSIFPLGSQNGGGKSTLLQLIFVLLHCSIGSERVNFLKNFLKGFNIDENQQKRVLAIIDIWDGIKTIKFEFCSYQDDCIKNILNIESEDEDNVSLQFSAYNKYEKVKNKILPVETQIKELEKYVNRLENLKFLEDSDEKTYLFREILDSLRESGFKFSTVTRIRSIVTELMVEEIQKEVQRRLDIHKLNIENLYEESEQLERILKNITKYLKSQNLIYVCNFIPNEDDDKYEEVLLCHVNNLDADKVESFMKNLSNHVFLAAPTTQVFLFLPEWCRKLLFNEQANSGTYKSHLQASRLFLKNFFTYDFLAVDTLIEYFKTVRDKDFEEALQTGEYGNSYKLLINDLNLILNKKKISLNLNSSQVIFKLDSPNESIQLYPEDLSHGELKRLSIYMWIKYHNIKDAIVLMDEIEIAFHPDWQYQIISDLYQWSPSNQYILATHSYELCQALTPAHVKEIEPKLLKSEAKN
jgi:predicted ATPase